MSRTAIRLGLILLPACTTLPVGEADQAIVGGEAAVSADFPTVVALENGPGNWFCTGTLIDKDWVLTAAHCVEGETAAGLMIRFDDTNINDTTGGKEIAVAEIHGNPDYNGVAWDNDIALIKLATSVTDREPTPIHRPVAGPPTPVIQVGYGAVSDADQVAGVLRKLSTITIDCASTMDASIMAANVLCFDQRDGNGTCYGDSGGPSFISVNGKYEVAAITSGGTVDSCMAGFDIQTAVAGELPFVDLTMTGVTPPDPNPDPNPNPNPTPPGGGDGSGGGCNTGGGSAGLLLVSLAALFTRRRRTR